MGLKIREIWFKMILGELELQAYTFTILPLQSTVSTGGAYPYLVSCLPIILLFLS